MKHLTRAAIVLAAAVIAAAVIALAVPAAAGQPGHTAPAVPCRAYHHGKTNGYESLRRWSVRHGTTVTQTLLVTLRCGDPGYSPRVRLYLDAGNLRRPMARGIMLWTVAAPPRCARLGCPG